MLEFFFGAVVAIAVVVAIVGFIALMAFGRAMRH